MEYHEFAVPAPLARHLQCAWRLRAPSARGAVQTIYPDGRCELVVHLGSPPRCWDTAGGWQPQSRAIFAAQRLGAVRLASDAPIDCFGLRLQPAASACIAPRGLAQFRGRIVDLARVDESFARRLVRAVRRFVRGDESPLWRLLEARCAAFGVDERVEAACSRLDRTAGRTRIDQLAGAARLSPRGFQVRFLASVGLLPKEFARLARLQAILRALDEHRDGLAAIAHETGFADQSHATRELRRATGMTPARLRMALLEDRDGDAAIRLAAAFVRGSTLRPVDGGVRNPGRGVRASARR